jgi:hypothetical protein
MSTAPKSVTVSGFPTPTPVGYQRHPCRAGPPRYGPARGSPIPRALHRERLG